jgi:hypothetical protein
LSKKIDVPVSKPELKLGWVKYLNRDANKKSSVFTSLYNPFRGTIDSAEIRLVSIRENENKGDSKLFKLGSIPGNSVPKDSVIFFCNTSETYKLGIKINNREEYFTYYFILSNSNNHSLSVNIDNLVEKTEISWECDGNGKNGNGMKYNIYLCEEDTTSNPVLLNDIPVLNNFFELVNDRNGKRKFIRLSCIDENYNEIKYSPYYRLSKVGFYKNSPIKLSPYQLFDPFVVDEKLISNSHNSSIYGMGFDLNPLGKNGIIHNSEESGVAPSYNLQGYSLGDINNDGNMDMITYLYSSSSTTLVKVTDLTTGELLGSIDLFGYVLDNSPVVVDYDDDDNLEIMVSMFDRVNFVSKKAYLYMLDFDEDNNLNIVENFPLVSLYGAYYIHSASISDLDKDGRKEIIFNAGNRIVIHDAKTLENKHNFALDAKISGAIQFIDIDEDGSYEMFVLTHGSSAKAKLFVYKYDGNGLKEVSGWERGKALDAIGYSIYQKIPPPVFGDIDGDNKIETIVVTGKKIYAFKQDGSNCTGFPKELENCISTNGSSSPTLAEFDGDNYLDIFFADSDYRLWCYSSNPSYSSNDGLLEEFPIKVPNEHRSAHGCLPVGDFDKDGDLEFAAGNFGGKVYVYDYPQKTSSRKILSHFRADIHNSGIFQRDKLLSISEKDENLICRDFKLLKQYPNPFNPSTKIEFVLPNAGNVDFSVFNIRGQQIYNTKNVYKKKGFKSITFSGENLSSGIYFYSLKYEKRNITGRCMLLK